MQEIEKIKEMGVDHDKQRAQKELEVQIKKVRAKILSLREASSTDVIEQLTKEECQILKTEFS